MIDDEAESLPQAHSNPSTSVLIASCGTEGVGPSNLIQLRFRYSRVGRKKGSTTKVDADGEDCVMSLDENDEASATKNENTEEETETDSPPPKRYELFMLDNFETPGRTFGDGSNTRWTDLHNNYYTNYDQHFYSCDNAYTNNYGDLFILTKVANTNIIGFDEVTKKSVRYMNHFHSAMIQVLDKFCYAGGVMEA